MLIAGKELDITAGTTIEQAVIDNGYHPDSFLYVVGGRPVPMDTVVTDNMVVKAMKVASGG